MIEEHVQDLIPAYALGALDAEDERRVDAHLPGCAQCRAELKQYQQLCGLLPRAARQLNPPARLRAAILRAAKPAPARWPNNARGWLPTHPAWAIVGLALIALLLLSNVLLWRQARQTGGQASDFRTVALAGTNTAPGASGLLVISPDGRYGALIADHLPDLPQGKAFQLWLIQDGERTDGGVIETVRNGYAVMRIYSRDPLTLYTSFGVTVEPAGGSPKPTGEKVLGGGL